MVLPLASSTSLLDFSQPGPCDSYDTYYETLELAPDGQPPATLALTITVPQCHSSAPFASGTLLLFYSGFQVVGGGSPPAQAPSSPHRPRPTAPPTTAPPRLGLLMSVWGALDPLFLNFTCLLTYCSSEPAIIQPLCSRRLLGGWPACNMTWAGARPWQQSRRWLPYLPSGLCSRAAATSAARSTAA